MKQTFNISRRQALKIGAGAALASGGPLAHSTITAAGADEKRDRRAEETCAFPFLIIRLHPRHHRDQTTLEEMVQLFQSKPGVCDEVWFCTEFGFPDLKQHRESAEWMAKAAERIRKLSIAAGLQVANTIGHGGLYANPIMASGKQRLMGHDGAIAPSCNCPRDDEFLDYQRQLADIYAAAIQPSSIWIDDDLRMNSHPPIQYGCFCPKCLADFSLLQSRAWSREALVAELGKPEQSCQLRLDWVEFSNASLANVARVISEAAVKRAPDCRMGLQQCSLDWSAYYGPDLNQIFSAMQNASGRKPGSRLGHGYYTDHAPRGVLAKSFGIARQVERAGDLLEQVCPEVENTSHTSMGKSPRGTAIESTLHLAMGCNSLSYALWNDAHLEGPEWMGLFLDKFKAWRPLWKRMVEYNKNSCLGGLDLCLGRRHAARPISPKEKSWDFWNIHFNDVMQISTLGLPLCPDSPLACASLLTAEAASGLTNEELRRLFTGGVLLDGAAVALLQNRSLGFDLGVRSKFIKNSGAGETLTNDPLNGASSNTRWSQTDDSFYKLYFNTRAHRSLGEMSYSSPEDEAPPCATAIFENELGGRVGVLGFNGFHNVISSAKRMQLLKMADWISGNRLPAILETSAQVVVCPRLDKTTGALKCVTLLNASIGETLPLALRLRHANSDRVTMYSAEGVWQTRLKALKQGADLVVHVPSVSPWGIVFLALE